MVTSNPADQSAHLLKMGIQAARTGHKDQAQKLLLQVLDLDDRNERAWLWLSGVVKTDEDRIVCLENVLAINPESDPAKRGLTKLQPKQKTAVPPTQPPSDSPMQTGLVGGVHRVERPPISAAAAVLYPERQIMEIPWQDSADLQTIPTINYESKTRFDDVWEKETDICAYCAREVDFKQTRCPACNHNLKVSHFRYPKPTSDLIVYFVLILGTAQLYFIQALIDLIIQEPLLVVGWNIFLFLVLLGLSFAIVFRQFWAYSAGIIILVLIFLSMLFDVSSGLAGVDVAQTQSGLNYFESIANNQISFIFPVLEMLGPFQMLAILLAILYGLFKAGPDFERVELRQIARVEKGLADASAYYQVGKTYAGEKMWAAAVLHYQRAAANEPNRAYYHLAAGKAYLELGFKERAKDALTSARRLTNDEMVISEIDSSLAAI